MLAVEHLTIRYGPVGAVRDLTFSVGEGEAVALLGANGAGKSSTLLAIMGVVRPEAGSITFDDHALGGLSPETIARRGLALVPEGRHMFARLTVEENLRLGASARRDQSAVAADRAAVYERFPALAQRRRQRAGTLSGGEQQQLAIGRALLARPRLLLLDEPSLGLAPLIIDEVFRALEDLRAEGMTILLVEQYAHRALEFADSVCVLHHGELVQAGPATELLASGAIEDTYLGTRG